MARKKLVRVRGRALTWPRRLPQEVRYHLRRLAEIAGRPGCTYTNCGSETLRRFRTPTLRVVVGPRPAHWPQKGA